MASYAQLAPAKINLCLRILGRRLDGYHELDGLMLPLAFGDQLQLEIHEGTAAQVSCRCTPQIGLDDDNNIAALAAKRYLQRTNLEATVNISIVKRIWVAAGLGGGSSDAAAVLLLLERHFAALGDDLPALALELGADVPFFLGGVPCHAQGIGERLSPVDPMPRLDLVLLNPGHGLRAADVYRRFDADSPAKRNTGELLRNDLQAAATALCPAIDGMLAKLRQQGALATLVSGSGPTVFGIFESAAAASRASAYLANNTSYFSISTHTRPSLTLKGGSPI